LGLNKFEQGECSNAPKSKMSHCPAIMRSTEFGGAMDFATVLISGIVAVILGWVSPLGKFQVEKLQSKREAQRKLISDGRHHLASLLSSDESPTLFLEDYQYLAIRPFLSRDARLAIEGDQTPTPANTETQQGIHKSPRLSILAIELERLERKWKLI